MKDTIKSIAENLRDIARVSYLDHYPKKDKYIQISLYQIPFGISKGHDEFWFGGSGYDIASKRTLWYVYRTDEEHPDLFIEQGFVTYQKAIKACIDRYREVLTQSMDDLNSFVRNTRIQ